MDIRIDPSIAALGVKDVVVGIAKNVNPHAAFSEAFLKRQKQAEEWALSVSLDEVAEHPLTQGYMNLMKSVGRSVKKNVPSVLALVRNVQHRGSMPQVNSIVDIYNVESLLSMLAIGGHDLDKIDEPLIFKVSGIEDTFYPIESSSKHVAPTDFLYCDAKGIVSWMGVRDGEAYKLDENTTNVLFTIAGSAEATTEVRLEALKHIEEDLVQCMPGVEFSAQVVRVEA